MEKIKNMCYKKVLFALSLAFLGSCNDDNPKKITITWDAFPTTHTLKGQQVDLPKLPLSNGNVYVLRDTIGLALFGFGNMDSHHAALIDLNRSEVLQKIFPKGRGPSEFEAVVFQKNAYNYSHDDELMIQGFNGKFLTYRLDSLLKYGDVAHPIRQLVYRSSISRHGGIARLNDKDYICFNPWYIGYGNYVNKDAPPLFKTNQTLEDAGTFAERSGHATKYHVFFMPRIVNTHPQRQNVILVDMHSDHIGVYDKKTLSLKKELIGPNVAIPKVLFDKNRGRVHIKRGTQKIAYGNCFHNDDFIYLAYLHGSPNIMPEDYLNKNTSIFKIDWDGNLLACYHLDCPRLSGFSLSQDGKKLYANHYDDDLEVDRLLKYDLPD